MTLKIIGAGMAGLLAANMLRHHNPVVYEAQKELPNNHSAVLRFRTPAVGEALGIEFKKVTVIKGVLPWQNNVADVLSYAKKNLGQYASDRSIKNGIEVVDRYIAPPDLIQRMAAGVEINFGQPFKFKDESNKVISTIPMPALMAVLRYPGSRPKFTTISGTNVKARVKDCDAYVSLAVPDPRYAFSRLSITGDELIVEIPRRIGTPNAHETQAIAEVAAGLLGLNPDDVVDATAHSSLYQKIVAIDEHERKSFIFWASSVQGKAFSLGRFACWRPGLLMDDVVKDVRLIDSWIRSSTPGYAQDIHHARSSS